MSTVGGSSDLPAPRGRGAAVRRALLLSTGVTAALYLVPGGDIIAYPLLLLSTFVHEMGHGLAAELVGGDFVSLRVFGDGSGVALTASRGRVARAIISAGGLVGPAFAAALGFAVGRSVRGARIFVTVGGAFALLAALLWVDGLVGWITALVLGVVSIAIGVRGGRTAAQVWLVLLSVQLGLSVFSRGEYLFAQTAATGAGAGLSDSEAIAQALVGPYWLWGAVCGLVSVVVLAVGAFSLLRSAASDLPGATSDGGPSGLPGGGLG